MHFCSHDNISAASTLIVNSFAYFFISSSLLHFVIAKIAKTALHTMQRGLSVRPSAYPSKRKKVLLTFLYHMKGHFI